MTLVTRLDISNLNKVSEINGALKKEQNWQIDYSTGDHEQDLELNCNKKKDYYYSYYGHWYDY